MQIEGKGLTAEYAEYAEKRRKGEFAFKRLLPRISRILRFEMPFLLTAGHHQG